MLWKIENQQEDYIQLILERPGEINVDVGDNKHIDSCVSIGYSICLTIDEARELLESLKECIDKAENEI